MSQCKCQQQPDRYVSFEGIDCNGNARLLMAMIYRHIEQPERNNAFWDYFRQKATGGSGPKPDDLFMIHCHLNQIRDLFEQWEDLEALTLLDRIEVECC
ncbi:N(2)-fixation sustaining protein CowN [Pseudaeromonas sharmana]|uniref:N(2)-fixation sustaining protein CowN n=1 Tax=Pseudaeromonas sharmana TaxID=328412 RepID=A0ABV8CKY2_9GAMM